MQTNFTTAIARGMAWLDQEHPGWEEKIDLEKLNLKDPCMCVLGQLEGEYWKAYDRITAGIFSVELRTQWVCERGFNVESMSEYRALTEEWKTAIRERLANHAQNDNSEANSPMNEPVAEKTR